MAPRMTTTRTTFFIGLRRLGRRSTLGFSLLALAALLGLGAQPLLPVGADSAVTAKVVGSGGPLSVNQPVVGMAATPTGNGYWLVASDGGIFAYGDAKFHGSTGNIHLAKPIVTLASTPSGKGYWFCASDGGIFAYGDAKYHGTVHPAAGVCGMARTRTGKGYWIAAHDGTVYSFGDAKVMGSAHEPTSVIVAS